ncbi:MAG: hypothetical protein J5504_02645, partial [Butyrivibrio sp.]|nr:hypothetical protein [Butyrivibrio sp.]
MNFSEFAHRLFSVMSGSSSAEVFTKTLFIELVNDEGKAIVKEKNISNFKAYFYNKSQITKFARVINLYIDKMGFIEFIDDYGDAVADNLCSKFSDVFQDVSPTNISEKLADCFVEIVTNAAKAKKTANSTKEISKGKDTSPYSETAKTGQEFVKKHLADVIPTITKSDNPFA